jgi:hypothetical protein
MCAAIMKGSNDFPLAVLDGTIVITSTRRNGEHVTLLTVQPALPPPRLTLPQWREWVAAGHARMVAELKVWIGRGVLALYDGEQADAPH